MLVSRDAATIWEFLSATGNEIAMWVRQNHSRVGAGLPQGLVAIRSLGQGLVAPQIADGDMRFDEPRD